MVADLEAFEYRYGNLLPVAGQWEDGDRLSNGGERLKLSFGAGDSIRDFTYDDTAPWPISADGGGASLVLSNPDAVPDHTLAANWRGSASPLGSPGAAEGESMFSSWMDEQGNTNPQSPFGDSGISLLLAYATGGDLVENPREALPVVSVVSVGDDLYPMLSYRVRKDANDVSYAVELSEDLISWERSPALVEDVSSPVDNDDGTLTYTVRAMNSLGSNSQQFLRLVVTVGQ